VIEPPWQPDQSIPDFAARIRWIVASDYEDEGASAVLPLLALADVLDAAAAVVKRRRWPRGPVTRLGRTLATLNTYR
jgi:hypothetical protein